MTKLRFWDRILSAVMGVLCIVLAAAILLYALGVLPVQPIKDAFAAITQGGWIYWAAFAAALLLLVLLGVHGIGLLFRRRKDKGFVVQHSEFGDMSISMKALENMVKKCVDAHGELTANQTKIYHVRNGVSIDMKVTLASGINIPLTVNALQKQIKQYITSCSGVDVHQVRVKVETDAVKLLPPPQTPVVEPEPVEEVKCVAAPAQPQCQYTDEPAHYTPETKAEETPAQPEPSAENTPDEPVPESVMEEPAAEKAVCEETAAAESAVEAAVKEPTDEEVSADA